MKLSKKQSELLAAEVLKALKKQGISHVPELTIAKIRQWKEKRDKLLSAEKEAEAARRRHDSELQLITGKINGIYPNNPISEIVDKMKQASVPTLRAIEDKIILKSMFSKEEDMANFVQSIVKEFTKKKPVAVN